MDFRRSAYGFTLIEIAVVISVLGILLAISIPKFMNTIASSAFKQDVELFTANLKETGTTAKKIGVLLPAELLTTGHPSKPKDLSTIITKKHCLWLICEKASTHDKAKTRVISSGVIGSRSPVTVSSTKYYQEAKSKNILTGVWIDLYSADNADLTIKTNDETNDAKPENGNPQHVARIIFEPNMLPNRAGILTFKYEGSGPELLHRVDIERSGVITLNTDQSDGVKGTRLDGE